MKKVQINIIRIITFIVVVPLISSCESGMDFLRLVAGRPTSSQVARKGMIIEARQKAFADSAALVHALEQQRIMREEELADSLQGAPRARQMGVQLSSVFSFGTPLTKIDRYSIIIGVYRGRQTAEDQILRVSRFGRSPFIIDFPGGEMAVCFATCPRLCEVLDTLASGRADHSCPKDAWIYVKP